MSNKEQKANILLIHADQHRADCLGAYGNKEISTPNIDQLASEGITYRNSFCPFPVCTPSRYSLLSGLYVHQHLGWTNHSTLPNGIATLPKLLKEAGYHTEAVGKMHFSPTYLDVGFSKMTLAEQNGPGRHDDDYHRYLQSLELYDQIDLMDQVAEYRKDAPDEYWQSFGALDSNLSEEHHSTTWIAKRALESINSWSKNSTNFLMVGFIKPHHPFDPPKPWSHCYDFSQLSLLPGWTENPLKSDMDYYKGFFPDGELTKKRMKQILSMYYASISQIDYQVGRIIESLKNQKIYDNTMIIYTSDHGDYMGYHNLLLKGNHLYEPLVKVPLIIKYPKHEKITVSNGQQLVNNIDLAPTILKSCNLDVPREMKGVDLNCPQQHSTIFAEARGEYMARKEDRKLLLCRDEKQSMYFDLKNDPFEMNNLYEDERYSDEIDELRKEIVDWILFDASFTNHHDWNAPVIDTANVVHHASKQHQTSIKYFKNKMC